MEQCSDLVCGECGAAENWQHIDFLTSGFLQLDFIKKQIKTVFWVLRLSIKLPYLLTRITGIVEDDDVNPTVFCLGAKCEGSKNTYLYYNLFQSFTFKNLCCLEG
jgi:hypothetical protein